MTLNCRESSAISAAPAVARSAGTRLDVVALGDRPGGVGQAAERVGEALRDEGGDDDREAEREQRRRRASSPTTLATALARNVYGSDSVTSSAYSRGEPSPTTTGFGEVVVMASSFWPARGMATRAMSNWPLEAGTSVSSPALSRVTWPRVMCRFAWAMPSARSCLLAGRGQTGRDGRVELAGRRDDERVRGGVLDGVHDDLSRRPSGGPSGRPGSGREVVVHPVDHDDADDGQGQGDESDRGEGEARLERAGPGAAQEALNARRTRSRLLERSGRTSASSGRPRSSRAGG